MAITSGFFDSVNGDRVYNAEQMTTYFEGLVSDGIYNTIGEAFVVRASEGFNITVGSGRALCRTHWIKNDTPATFTLSPASSEYPRHDAVVIRYDANARTVNIAIITGSALQNAPLPQPVRNEFVYDLIIAYIAVNKNAETIT